MMIRPQPHAASLLLLIALVVVRAEPVTINFDDQSVPFSYLQDGKVAGLYPAIFKRLQGRLPEQLQLDAKPWKRVMLEMDEGLACIGALHKTAERTVRFDYSRPYFVEVSRIYAQRPFPFHSVADLAGKRVGVIRGWTYGDAFEHFRSLPAKQTQLIVEETGSDTSNLKKLVAGRLDAAIVLQTTAERFMAENPGLPIVDIGELAANPIYMACNKRANKSALVERINVEIEAMKKAGEFAKLTAEYLR